MIRKLIPKFLLMLLFITSAATIGLLIHTDDEKKHDALFEHKYVAGDCIGFDLYDWDFERNSAGETIGQARIEYIRYGKQGAYYGLKLIDDIWRKEKNGMMNYPVFKYPKSKKPIGLVWAKDIDKLSMVHQFSFTDFIPGSKIVTIRNGMTCRQDWKNNE
jgi:hypothetical protein